MAWSSHPGWGPGGSSTVAERKRIESSGVKLLSRAAERRSAHLLVSQGAPAHQLHNVPRNAAFLALAVANKPPVVGPSHHL